MEFTPERADVGGPHLREANPALLSDRLKTLLHML